MTHPPLTDAAMAAVELVGRTGARGLQFGYLHDGVPVDEADWYAHAQYGGTRIIVEHHPGPVEALEALAVRLLTGAQCQHCKGLVALSRAGASFIGDQQVDGATFSLEEAQGRPLCRWYRDGAHWVRGCQ